MHLVRRLSLVLVAIAVLLCAGCVGGPHAPTEIPVAAVQAVLDSHVGETAPGLICAIHNATGSWSGAAGVADRASGNAMSSDMQLRIGSNTKQMVAAVVLQLRDEGTLALSDTVEHWLAGAVPDGDRITIAMLLNHTSGLPDYTEAPGFDPALLADPTHRWTPRELLDIAAEMPPTAEPAAAYAYTNTGYILLGMVVEAATGHALHEELSARIFAPLGLHRTRLATEAGLDAPFAHGYIDLGDGALTDATALSPSSAGAAGAVVSVASETVAWLDALMGGEVLTPDSLREMLTPVAPATDYGYGIQVIESDFLGERAYLHTGGFPGYHTVVLHTVETGNTLFVGANRYPGSEETVADATNRIAALLVGRDIDE